MKILLADDYAPFREGMGYVLRRLDEQIEILEVSNFTDALNAADNHHDLNLALLDFDMPGSEGAISVELFHERYPDIPVVVISCTDHLDNIEHMMNSGATGFISKMSSGQDMLNALHWYWMAYCCRQVTHKRQP